MADGRLLERATAAGPTVSRVSRVSTNGRLGATTTLLASELEAQRDALVHANRGAARVAGELAEESAELERRLTAARQPLATTVPGPTTRSGAVWHSSRLKSFSRDRGFGLEVHAEAAEPMEPPLQGDSIWRPVVTPVRGPRAKGPLTAMMEKKPSRSLPRRSPRDHDAPSAQQHLASLRTLVLTLQAQERALQSYMEQMPALQERIERAILRYESFANVMAAPCDDSAGDDDDETWAAFGAKSPLRSDDAHNDSVLGPHSSSSRSPESASPGSPESSRISRMVNSEFRAAMAAAPAHVDEGTSRSTVPPRPSATPRAAPAAVVWQHQSPQPTSLVSRRSWRCDEEGAAC